VARPPAPVETESRLRQIPIEDIHPNPAQPRMHFDEAPLNLLAGSIRERGMLQPIIVRPGMSVGFEIVAGERRWRATQIAGLSTIPALIDDSLDGAGSLELALIENVAREDLTVIEEARAIAMLLDDLHVTRTLLASRLGRSRSDLAHTIRLLELPDEAIELIDSGALTKGHGKPCSPSPITTGVACSRCAQPTPAGRSAHSRMRSLAEHSLVSRGLSRIPTTRRLPSGSVS
jgi:ParB family chromosome partitioning protein